MISVDQRHGTAVDKHLCLHMFVPHDPSGFAFVINIKSAFIIDCPSIYMYIFLSQFLIFFPYSDYIKPHDGVAICSLTLEISKVTKSLIEHMVRKNLTLATKHTMAILCRVRLGRLSQSLYN